MGHGTIWKKAEKVRKIYKVAMTKGHANTKYSLDKPYQVIIPTREDRGKDGLEGPGEGQVWFTDGACN